MPHSRTSRAPGTASAYTSSTHTIKAGALSIHLATDKRGGRIFFSLKQTKARLPSYILNSNFISDMGNSTHLHGKIFILLIEFSSDRANTC